MATHVPCQKNDANGYVTYVSLVSQANTKIFQANPTLAAGDVKIAVDDAAPANLGTLPAVDADFTKRVKVTLSQAETNGDNLTVIFSDAAGAEWCDLTINIQTSAQTLDTIDTNVDDIETAVITNAAGVDIAADIIAVKAETAVINAFWNVFILTSGTIGAVGNDTTHLHLTGQTYGNDELNDYIVVVYDNSEAEYHSVWITDWVLATELATVETLAFTPQDSVDTYWVFSLKKHPDIASILAGTVTNAQGADVATDVALLVGTDGKALISTDAQDMSGTLDVNTKTITAGAIANASFNADVGSTAHGTNIIALACRKILEELNLDHLMKTAVANRADMTTEIADDTVLANIMTKTDGDTSDYAIADDSLEAQADAAAATVTNVALDTTLAVRTSDSVFTLNAGHGTNDAYNNMVLAIQDVTDSHWETRRISDYAGATKTITVDTAFAFVVAANDVIKIFMNAYAPTVAAGGGATAAQVWDYDVSGVTTQGYAGTYQQIAGGRYG